MGPDDAASWINIIVQGGFIAVAAAAIYGAYWLGSRVLDSFYMKMKEWTTERDAVHEANLTKIVEGHERAMNRLANAVESVENANEACKDAQIKIAEIERAISIELARRN